MENETQQHFRKTASGEIITVTELNTKITYTKTREYRLGRIVISHTHTSLRKTFAAHTRYFMYNNRVARFKRAVVPSVKQKLADIGLTIYVAQ